MEVWTAEQRKCEQREGFVEGHGFKAVSFPFGNRWRLKRLRKHYPGMVLGRARVPLVP